MPYALGPPTGLCAARKRCFREIREHGTGQVYAWGWASLSAAPVRWPTLEVGDSKDDQLRGFGSVHHGEREAFRADAPRLQLPWRTKLRMRGSKSGSCHHGLTELISEPLLLLFV